MTSPLVTCGTSDLFDFGNWLSQQALIAVGASIDALGLDPPGQTMQIGGTSLPIQDVCEHSTLLWARVAATFPTNGDGNPFVQARIDFTVPTWAWLIDVGILCCRTVIDAAGAAVDADAETEYAIRDGNYRLALIDGIANRWTAAVQPCALGIKFSPWTPIGPDGGVSGGFLQSTIVGPLATTGQC